MRYQRKINYVDAIQFTGDNWKQLEEFVGEENINGYMEDIHSKEVKRYSIKTPNGSGGVSRGDWVCRDVKGGVYPCTDEVFRATYYVDEIPLEVLEKMVPDDVKAMWKEEKE